MNTARKEGYWEGVGDADRQADGSSAVSRPSKNNRQGPAKGGEPPNSGIGADDLPDGTALRPISVEPGRKLRKEAVFEQTDEFRSRPWYAVVQAWREWYGGYENAHIEFDGPNGETARTRLENSYMPEYGKRYYAKLKDLERGIERTFQDLTTVMLTFSASNLNANGDYRAPGDHMREIAEGWDTARKQLHQVLSGEKWEYAKVWEPHESGYGHMHVAVFVEANDLDGERFRPVMDSYVENTKPAGTDAHTNSACSEHEEPEPTCDDCDTPISVNSDVNNLGTYISEYIGIFGEETLSRPIKEQMFYAVTWATNTRRVEFSNGAQEIQAKEKFRRDTGLRPEERGGDLVERWDSESDSKDSESAENLEGVMIDPENERIERTTDTATWDAEAICRADTDGPEYFDVGAGGIDMRAISGSATADPPARRE